MAAAPPSSSGPRLSRAEAQERRARAERLLGLFAWHRDAPLVARSLGLSLDELHAELDELKLRRKAYRLVRGSDAEFPIVKAVPGAPSGPPLRRRSRSASTAKRPPASGSPEHEATALEASPAPSHEQPLSALARDSHETPESAAARDAISGPDAVAEQAAQLLALLAEVGPRRAALAARLGSARKPLADRVLLARFRAAGLEREFGQRERDLLRGLFARRRGSREGVAADLKIDLEALQRLVRERGLEREVDQFAPRFRTRPRRPR
jgi:hypothetical protein